MQIDYEIIIRDGIAEGQAALAASAPQEPEYTEKQKQQIEELRVYAKDITTVLKVMEGRPGSKFSFEEGFLGTGPNSEVSEVVMSVIVLKTNIIHENRKRNDVYSVAISVSADKIALEECNLLNLWCNREPIESITTPTPLARTLAAATILRKVAAMAVQNKLIS